jgi:sugar O-acyltransferase (sialic acid O-acetyltransferase NeuD family)
MRVLIVGAGGHGHVVADVLRIASRRGSEWEPVGFVDDAAPLQGRHVAGLPVLGSIESLGSLPHDGVIVAIGDNDTRRAVFTTLQQRGERLVVALHPSAVIGGEVTIGPGSVVCAGVVVNPATAIGSNVILNTACSIDHHSRVGDHAHVGPGVHAGGHVTVEPGALVGIGATIMPGRTVGACSVVGAAALVERDVSPATVVVGVPARPVRTFSAPHS